MCSSDLLTTPTALNNGENGPTSLANPLNTFCVLYGTHRPYDAGKLRTLYGSHDTYVSKVKQTVGTLENQGFLLKADGDALVTPPTVRVWPMNGEKKT